MAQLLDYSNTHRARALFAWTQVLKMEGDTVAGPASPPTSLSHTHIQSGTVSHLCLERCARVFRWRVFGRNLVWSLILKPHFLRARVCRLKAEVFAPGVSHRGTAVRPHG